MEETKYSRGGQTIRWKKIGNGSFRLANGKIVKPNEIFTAKEEEIPVSFRDIVVRITPEQDVEKKQVSVPITPVFVAVEHPLPLVEEAVTPDFTSEGSGEKPTEQQQFLEENSSPPVEEEIVLVHEGRGWYNVVNSITGKALNANKLRKAEAEQFCRDLA